MFRTENTGYGHYEHKPDSARVAASLLFALGQTDAAWSAVREILPSSISFEPYAAAILGMRMASYDDDARLSWRLELLQNLPRNNPSRESMVNEFVTTVIFQTTVLDRKVESLDNVFFWQANSLMVRTPKPPAGAAPIVHYAVSSPLDSLLLGYVAYRKGEHDKARESLSKLLAAYDELGYPPIPVRGSGTFWSAMPYLAISLAKAGKQDEASRLPQRLTWAARPANSQAPAPGMTEERMPAFERKLIAGICDAFAGNHAEAQRLMREAQGSLAEPGDRLIPPGYEFVEVLETLANETGKNAYRKIALAFVRGIQVYEPWAGWAYAFDAAYSADGEQRVRAAALAMKFDPKSVWLSKLSPALLARARDWLSRNDPFRIRAPMSETKS